MVVQVQEAILTISTEQIESVAPDQASLNAASKLLKRAKWPMLEQNAEGTLLWGQCQGSGSTPYSMAVATHDLGAKCSCPSRKFPCKHSIALMWWFADNAAEFTTGETPEWVSQWVSRRRGNAATDSAEGSTESKVSISHAAADAIKPEKKLSAEEQKKKAERAAKQQLRNREKREQSILQGLDELDLWITDQIEEGFAGFETRAQEQSRTLIKRLVDAKAPGIALRVESAMSEYFAADLADRNNLLIETFGMLHLLANAYRKQHVLPTSLQADVRQTVGWTIERDSLLKDADATRITGEWMVTGTREETQTDRMIRQETWLMQLDSDEHPVAVLVDFVPVSSGAGKASLYRPGQKMNATLVYYPSSTPLRALLVDPTPDKNSTRGEVPVTPDTVADALSVFYEKRAINPWLAKWPISLGMTTIQRSSDERLWATNADASVAIAIKSADAEKVSVLLGLDNLTVHGLFDGVTLEPLAAATPLGAWWSAEL